jgi:hypothetical protein
MTLAHDVFEFLASGYKLANGQCVNEASRAGKKFCRLNAVGLAVERTSNVFLETKPKS